MNITHNNVTISFKEQPIKLDKVVWWQPENYDIPLQDAIEFFGIGIIMAGIRGEINARCKRLARKYKGNFEEFKSYLEDHGFDKIKRRGRKKITVDLMKAVEKNDIFAIARYSKELQKSYKKK